MMDKVERFIGIDVSKDLLEIATLPEKESWSIRNDEAEVEALVKRLQALGRLSSYLRLQGEWRRWC